MLARNIVCPYIAKHFAGSCVPKQTRVMLTKERHENVLALILWSK